MKMVAELFPKIQSVSKIVIRQEITFNTPYGEDKVIAVSVCLLECLFP